MDYTQILNDVVTAVISILGIFGCHKLGWLTFLKQEAPTIVHMAQDVAKIPAVKAVEAELHIKLHSVEGKLAESELIRYALVGLHAFGDHLGNLSDTQFAALTVFIRKALPADTKVTDKEIQVAIQKAQDTVDAVAKSNLFQLATQFTNIAATSVPTVVPLTSESTAQANQDPVKVFTTDQAQG